MDFKKLTLEQIKTLKKYFENNDCRICDCTSGGTFIWRDFFKTHYAEEEGILYLKVTFPSHGTAFSPPRSPGEGADLDKPVYERVIELSREAGLAPRICAASEAVKDKLLEFYPGSTVFTNRDWSDYLYQSEHIVTLAGRKFSGQRNHINKFLKAYPNWSFDEIDETNAMQARDFIIEYAAKNVRNHAVYDEGNLKNIEVLENFELYGLFGGILSVDGSIIGTSIGETVGDTLFVHMEKADISYLGAYAMLVNQFARKFAADGILYINREEDDGVEGLRTSKLSYHPHALLGKYIVELIR